MKDNTLYFMQYLYRPDVYPHGRPIHIAACSCNRFEQREIRLDGINRIEANKFKCFCDASINKIFSFFLSISNTILHEIFFIY